tara:strand:+ start:303 stop:431 length:129 start_codon:yes stop_codon:yes gene_type:complete
MKTLNGIVPKCCDVILYHYDVMDGYVQANCHNCGIVKFEVKA